MAPPALLLALLAPAATHATADPVHALRYGAHGNALTPYDPVTLRPAGPAVRLGRFAHAWSTSPDRRTFVAAVGVRRPGEEAALRFVDLRRGRVAGTARLAGERSRVAATAWAGGRVLAVVSRPRTTSVFAVDAATRTVVARVELDGVLVSGVRTPPRLVLLLAPAAAIGPATVAVVDGVARARTVVLERIRAGTLAEGGRTTVRRPGLAASPSGRHLYVFGGGEPAAAVDLRTLAVRYRPERATAALRKRAQGSVRSAATLPDGRVVVWGSDYGSRKPVGASLVQPRDWSSQRLEAASGWIEVDGGLIFTRRANGVGLRLLHPDGRPVDLFRTGSPASVDVVGRRALVRFFGRGVSAAVLDLDTRRVVGRRVPANLLLEGGQAIG
jgi:hypothetical protein